MSKQTDLPLPQGGMDVRSNETALGEGTVRLAMNVDIGRDGRYKRRDGFSLVQAGVDLHSLYYSKENDLLLVCSRDKLNIVDVDAPSLTPIYTLKSTDPVDYTEYNGNIYFSNYTSTGYIRSGELTAQAIGVPTPISPTLSVNAVGGLDPGTYGVSLTLINSKGEVSGATRVQTIKLTTKGGIQLSDLPQTGTQFEVFVTPTDGEVLRSAGIFNVGFTEVLITDVAEGAECETLYLEPLQAGSFIRWHNGRLLTAKESTLYFSQPMRPHLFNRGHDYLLFSGSIKIMESVSDGLYVGDDRGVWFLSGADPEQFNMKRVSAARPLYGTGLSVASEHFNPKMVDSDHPVAVWLSEAGYMIGLPGGRVLEAQADRILVDREVTGRSAFLSREGRKQVVTTVNSGSTANAGAALDSVI